MEKRKIAWLVQQAAVAHLRALKSNIKACGRINREAKIKERRQNKQRGGSCVRAGRLLLPEQQSKATREMPLPWQEVYLWLFSSGTWLLAAVCCAHSSWKSHASSCLRLSLPVPVPTEPCHICQVERQHHWSMCVLCLLVSLCFGLFLTFWVSYDSCVNNWSWFMCRTSWQGGSLALCFGRAWGVWQQQCSTRWDGCCAHLFLALRAAFGFCLVKQTMKEGMTEQRAVDPLNLPGGKLHQRWSSRDWEQAWRANEFWVQILRHCKLRYLLKSIYWKKEFTETQIFAYKLVCQRKSTGNKILV